MAHYAFLDENNIVTQVIVGRDEDEIVDGISDWEAHYGEFVGQVCKRTSYNTRGNVNIRGGEPFRYNYAGVGYTFDPTIGEDGAFIPPKPQEYYVLNEETCLWELPKPYPEDGGNYFWNEETLDWEIVVED